jgi:DNA polymerase-1
LVGAEAVSLLRASDSDPARAMLGLAFPGLTPGLPRKAPHFASAAFWCPGRVLGLAVIDLRQEAQCGALEQMINSGVVLVAHDVKEVLLGLWCHGVDVRPRVVFDTRLAEVARAIDRADDDAGHMSDPREAMRAKERQEYELGLERSCYRHGVVLDLPKGSGWLAPGLDVASVGARAAWTLALAGAQRPALDAEGILGHLERIEFPALLTLAEIEHRGVPAPCARRLELATGCRHEAERQAERLAELGVSPPHDEQAMRARLRRQGVLDRFPQLTGDVLRAGADLDPAVTPFRRHREFSRLAREEWLSLPGERVYPEHVPLGARTGRLTCRRPSLTCLPSILRPVVVAPDGRALVELDYGQIDIGVAAALTGDEALIADFNCGDVYSRFAQRVYRRQLTATDVELQPAEFRRAHKDLRNRVKGAVFALLYGAGDATVATKLGQTEREARALLESLWDSYPALKTGLDRIESEGRDRGYAVTIGGLRRGVPASAAPGGAGRMLRNTPIQGSAADVFKRALALLGDEFAGSGTWIVLPMHDGVLIECDVDKVEAVCARGQELMVQAFQEFFPALRPRVDVNASAPWCWNKDGDAESLARFIAGPESATGETR